MMLHLVFWNKNTLRFPKFWFLFMVTVMVHYHPFGQKEILNIEEALWCLHLWFSYENWVFEQYMFWGFCMSKVFGEQKKKFNL